MQSLRKGVAMVLILAYASALFAQTTGEPIVPEYKAAGNNYSYNDKIASEIAGRRDASEKHGTVGWGVFGIASGFLFGLIGLGASTVISIVPSPEPDQQPEGVVDLEAYTEAYKSKARQKNIVTTATLATVGWLISIPVVLAMKK